MASTTASKGEGIAWPTKPEGYTLCDLIGTGSSAKVYRAVIKDTTTECAVKILNLEMFSDCFDMIRKEIVAMSKSNHPNVVAYHTSFVHQTELWLVMAFLGGGSCHDIMRFSFKTGMDESMIATILRETLKALEYFHKSGLIHRDVKAGNILIDMKGNVQLADFGVASALVENGQKNKAQTFVGTPCWMAPEVMEQVKGYDFKADIWSFGITALELAEGRAPKSNMAPMKVLLTTLSDEPPKLNRHKNGYSRTFKNMVQLCLQKDPSKRPTATELLGHGFFKKAKKPTEVVSVIIAKLPPLGERQSLIAQAAADEDREPVSAPILSIGPWDFENIKKEAAAMDSGDAGGESSGDECTDPEDEIDERRTRTAKPAAGGDPFADIDPLAGGQRPKADAGPGSPPPASGGDPSRLAAKKSSRTFKIKDRDPAAEGAADAAAKADKREKEKAEGKRSRFTVKEVPGQAPPAAAPPADAPPKDASQVAQMQKMMAEQQAKIDELQRMYEQAAKENEDLKKR